MTLNQIKLDALTQFAKEKINYLEICLKTKDREKINDLTNLKSCNRKFYENEIIFSIVNDCLEKSNLELDFSSKITVFREIQMNKREIIDYLNKEKDEILKQFINKEENIKKLAINWFELLKSAIIHTNLCTDINRKNIKNWSIGSIINFAVIIIGCLIVTMLMYVFGVSSVANRIKKIDIDTKM